MRYVSTRGGAAPLDFAEVTLAGLAGDGGLFMPEAWPRVGPLPALSYVETAVAVIRPFVGGAVPDGELAAMLADAYATFEHSEVTPLIELGGGHWLLELHHGPTLAFKDVAMQLLGRLFARFLGGAGLTIVGATSGDTGSAAIHALKGLANVGVVMLHPRGRTSEIQRRQMTTVLAPNIHNVAVEGDFDQCQAMVKALLRAPPVGVTLSAVNSINWARLMAQVVYYFHAAARLPGPAVFSVPTGNFGDVFAGWVAAAMGCPMAGLIVATNANDVLHRALTHGNYSKAVVVPTASPSMDIQVSSNFERLLFDLVGRDAAALRAMMAGFEATGRLAIGADVLAGAGLMRSAAVGEDECAATLRWAWERHGQLLDPHTGVGLAAARRLGGGGAPVVTLATAHAAKFPDAVEAATGVRPAMPARLAGLMAGEERCDVLPARLDVVRAYVAERAAVAT